MPFTKEIPEWNAAGAEPPQSLKDSGWSPDDRPPAEYWNWQMNLTYLALQELQQLAETKGHASKHASGGSDPISPSDIGAEPTITKNTGFNKNFGTSAGTVSEGNHSHTPSDVGAEPAFTKNTGFNKEFGTTAGTVTEGNYAKQIKDDLATHQANYVPHIPFAVASGSANTYTVTLTPAPTSYVNGMAVSVAINADATGASTLNVNSIGAIPIKKANGNDATNLKQNGVYTFRYYDDGTNASFILQGEGGEGTAQPGDVLSGETFTNDDGVYNGTMTNQGAYDITPTTTNQAIPQGYHDGQGIVSGDPDLVSANIRNGVSLFGVAGKNTVVDTQDANMPDGGVILEGNSGYADGVLYNGTMPYVGAQTITPGTTQKTINKGYHDGNGVVSGDADLVSGNIRAGVTLFGITGNSNVVNTGAGTASASQILDGMKAFVDGSQITGTMPNHSSKDYNNVVSWANNDANTNVAVDLPNGYYNGKNVGIVESNLTPNNIKDGVDIFGVTGNLEPRLYNSGSTSKTGNGEYTDAERTFSVNLGFRPKTLILRCDGYDYSDYLFYENVAYSDQINMKFDHGFSDLTQNFATYYHQSEASSRDNEFNIADVTFTSTGFEYRVRDNISSNIATTITWIACG